MKEITQEILDELNNEYSDAIFEFVFQPDMDGVVDIKLKKQYNRYIDSRHYHDYETPTILEGVPKNDNT